MTVALIIVLIAYVGIATLIAINSVLELANPPIRAVDAVVIALVAVSWPVICCALLALLVIRGLFARLRGASAVP